MQQFFAGVLALVALSAPSFGQVLNNSVWTRPDGTLVTAIVRTNTVLNTTTVSFTDAKGSSPEVTASATAYGGGVTTCPKATTTNAAGNTGGTYKVSKGTVKEKVNGTWEDCEEKLPDPKNASGGGVGTLPE